MNIGLKISDIEIGVEFLRSDHTNLTLSNTKLGTDLGMLVVQLDQTFHPLHKWGELGRVGKTLKHVYSFIQSVMCEIGPKSSCAEWALKLTSTQAILLTFL